jgi:diadenylate cyclase
VHDLLSEIVSAFSRFTLASALDILIVTVLFYSVLMLVRGTRADQVLRGVILLFIFFSIMVALFHLTMVDWLLHNSPLVLLVAIPIIFQPELRRALEQVGRTSAIINHPLATLQIPLQPSTGDEILDAVHRCAEHHYGALIVLEGQTGLEDFVRSGTRVYGDVTSDLLVNLFSRTRRCTTAPSLSAVIVLSPRVVFCRFPRTRWLWGRVPGTGQPLASLSRPTPCQSSSRKRREPSR